MARLRRRAIGDELNPWPGYVDALSTLLMVIIFVLLVFVLAQAFLGVALSSRDRALDRLNAQVAELAEMLALERGRTGELQSALARTAEELRAAAGARDTLTAQLRDTQAERDRLGGERDSVRADRDRLAARLSDLELSTRGGGERLAALEGQLAEAQRRAESVGGDVAQTVRRLTEAGRGLAAEQAARQRSEARQAELEKQAAESRGAAETARRELAGLQRQVQEAQAQLAAMRSAMAALDRQVAADKAVIEARLSDIAKLSEQVRALTALRDQLERQAQEAARRTEEQARARSAAEAAGAGEAERRQAAERAAAEQGRLAESARAQVALLSRQIEELRAQLGRLTAALDAAETSGRDKEAQILSLGTRLNAALAARVEELQRYRSDFFGKLRDLLGDRPDVRIVGDRFVFQSEVLFPPGSAELSAVGKQQLGAIAKVLQELAQRIPSDVNWLLRVDGHADRTPVRAGARYATNWELSAARAIAVSQLLMAEGLPPNRVAATAFGDNQPLDPGDTPEALARNRRIELRLTDR